VLEFLARLECTIRAVAPDVARPADYLIDRHFLRKHGSHAYYGQG
jgi:L-ribulose-5-phosphate 4-epimerase